MNFATLHHPLQYRPLAEALDSLEVPLELFEALRVAFQDGALFRAPDFAVAGRRMWHYSILTVIVP
jgi:hypothetical protein